MRKEPVSFRTEATERFQFLVDLNHLDGPEYSEMLLPAVWYTGSGLWIFLPPMRHTRLRDTV
jgi:hypothetical protein